MPPLSDADILRAVIDAGFPSTAWTTAVAVALAESGGMPDATNKNTNGSTDYGLFQINSIHAELLNTHTWNDPVENARMALEISSRGANWRPWVAYTTGRHVVYIPRAKAALADVRNGGGRVAEPAPAESGGGGITGFFGLVTDGHTWLRVGFVIVGAALLWIAILQATGVAEAGASAAKLYFTKGAMK